MHADYYQNTLYPLQDKVLNVMTDLPVNFYLTGGTALSRAYLHHRYSDDLDFFVNNIKDFKEQVNIVLLAIDRAGFKFDVAIADEGYARAFIVDGENVLKIDFVNDVAFRHGHAEQTPLFIKTDNLDNILSNKITALGRYSPKDVVDLVFISACHAFNWEKVMNDATEKDLWVNPIVVAEVLEQFPITKLDEIAWINDVPSKKWITDKIQLIIAGIIKGNDNIPQK